MQMAHPFPPGGPCLSAQLLRPFLLHLRALPGALQPPLEALDLPGHARVPLRRALGLLEEAVYRSDDALLGLSALSHLERGTGDVLELAAASAPNLGEALQLISRHIRVLNEAASFSLHADEPLAALEMRSELPLSRAALDFQAGALLLAIQSFCGDVRDVQVWLSYGEPRSAARYVSTFAPAHVRFGAPCDALVLPASKLAQPLRGADPVLHAVLKRYLEQLSQTLPEDSSVSTRVRTLLLELLPHGHCDASTVARRMCMSRRTMTRYLEREGTTFRELLEGVREALALRYLERTNLEPQRIAQLLGYSETAAFCRAFQRWRGCTATLHRRSLSAAASGQPARDPGAGVAPAQEALI